VGWEVVTPREAVRGEWVGKLSGRLGRRELSPPRICPIEIVDFLQMPRREVVGGWVGRCQGFLSLSRPILNHPERSSRDIDHY